MLKQDRNMLKQDRYTLKQDRCTFRQDRTLLTQEWSMFGQDQTTYRVPCVFGGHVHRAFGGHPKRKAKCPYPKRRGDSLRRAFPHTVQTLVTRLGYGKPYIRCLWIFGTVWFCSTWFPA